MEEIHVGQKFKHKFTKEICECVSVGNDEHFGLTIKIQGLKGFIPNKWWFGTSKKELTEFNRYFSIYHPITKPQYFNL